MTPDWYGDLAERLAEAEHEASFAGDAASATRFRAAIAAAGCRAGELVAGPTPLCRHDHRDGVATARA